MRLISAETVGDSEIFYRMVVEEREGSWLAFWNNKTKTTTYVGNTLGWYDIVTGCKSGRKVYELLTGEVRAISMREMIKEHDLKKKPSMSIVKKED